MASNASPLEAIQHIVVLMLAGRSFDHMLGFLYPGNVSPSGQPFDGLTGTESNPGSDGQPVTVFRIEPGAANAYRMPGASPGQGYQATNSQLYGSATGPSSSGQPAPSQGFVVNYADALRLIEQAGSVVVPGTVEGDIMGCFAPATLPVLSALAKGYAVCDRWFSPVPAGTRPNRAFAFAATSQGHLDNEPRSFSAQTIFDLLERHSVTWGMYGYNAAPLTRDMFNGLSAASVGHFGLFADFLAAAAAGTLARFTVLEPSWGETGNSQQPPSDVARGEQLIHDVYEALRNGPGWTSTLLVITYDQHGGLYDHVPPPSGAVPPDSNLVGESGFGFTRFGVRVPAVLVSPLIEPGTVYRTPAGSVPLDHTSILKTVEQRWGQPSLTARDAAAPGLGDVLTLAAPRTDDVLAGITPPVTLTPGPDAPPVSPETAAGGPPADPGTSRPSTTLGSRLDPAYVSDTVQRTTLVEGEDDPLGIRSDVNVLAAVIASAKISPPMSIGLFGDWGAGKSFFMNQLRLQVAQLSDDTQRTPARRDGRAYCRALCPIEFNAWQYASGQELWASLVSRVFEGLLDYFGGDEHWQELKQKLTSQSAQVTAAEARYRAALIEVGVARKQKDQRTIADLQNTDPQDAELRRAADRYAGTLGLDKETTPVAEVEQRVQDLRTPGGRLRLGARIIGRRRLAVIGVVAACLLTAVAFLPGTERVVTYAVGVSGSLIALGTLLIKLTDSLRKAGEQLLRADPAQVEAAEDDLRKAKAEKERLEQESARSLYGFVEERYRTDDYRKYMGMVPLIHRDLERLSRASLEAGQEDPNNDGGPRLDRVVLYIDDLDRCSTQQVIKVLEAVNLLFGFPLFVVVIAVDSRWLLRSLAQEFSSVFQSGGSAAPTPQDYLEKIIQIPFWIRPMDTEGFARLMESLAAPTAANPSDASSSAGDPVASRGTTPGGELASVAAPGGPVTGDGTKMTSLELGGLSPGGEPAGTSADARESPATATLDDLPEISITAEELAFVRGLAPLISTPRAAKRFFNTYQLVRLSLNGTPAPADYQPLLTLLALVTTSPALSAAIVEAFIDSGAADLLAFLQDRHAPQSAAGLARKVAAMPGMKLPAAAVRRWLPVVGRFSFQPGLDDALSTSGRS